MTSRRNPPPYEYGLALRPFGFASVPSGFSGFRSSPTFRHGIVQYEKPLNFSESERYDLVPLDPRHPQNLMRVRDAFREHIMDVLSRDNIVVFDRSGGDSVALHFSTRPGVTYQISFFSYDLATGHMEFADFDEAAQELQAFAPRELLDEIRARVLPRG